MDIGNVIAAVVVLAVLGAVFGFILAVASKVFEVKKDPREEEILSHLAGANCGGCGFPGCAGCAAAILAGTAPVNACAPAGAENAAAIAKIMGQEAPSGERRMLPPSQRSWARRLPPVSGRWLLSAATAAPTPPSVMSTSV